MTAATPARTATISTAPARPVSFLNVVAVEFRKLVSTTPMRVLLIISVLALLGIGTALTVYHDKVFSPETTGVPEWAPWIVTSFLLRLALQFLLPAMIVLHLTSEWTTRSAMTTFTLVPRRGQVIAAKGVVMLVVTAVSYALIAGIGIAATWIGRTMHDVPTDNMWIGVGDTAKDALLWLLMMASAFALGLLLHNGALAIAVVLASPTVLQMLRQVGGVMNDIFQWIDLHGIGQQVLQAGDNSSIPKLIVASAVWIFVPLALGAWRTMTREAA